MARRQYTGGAPKTTLAAAITSTTPASFTITDGTGYPSGATAFVVVIDRGRSNEEKKLVTRSGTTMTVVTNGFDSSTAATHSSGADVEHCVTGVDLDEANALVNLADAKGDIIAATAADTWARVAAGADDTILMYDSSQAAGVKAAASAAPSGAFSTSSSIGTADTWLRSDAQFTLFDATVPARDGTAAAGTATVAARRDHVHPGTFIGQATVTANQTGIGGGPTDLTSLTVTFTAVASRRYKITGYGRVVQRTSGATAEVFIRNAANTKLQTWSTTLGVDESGMASIEITDVPGAGSATYKLSAGVGAGTMDLTASATQPAFILVEDITG